MMITIEQAKAIKSLTLEDFMIELGSRLDNYERKTDETNERAVDLEQCVYFLLKTQKPTEQTYKQVEDLLRPLQPQLRNLALYDLSCKRANVSGSKYMKEVATPTTESEQM